MYKERPANKAARAGGDKYALEAGNGAARLVKFANSRRGCGGQKSLRAGSRISRGMLAGSRVSPRERAQRRRLILNSIPPGEIENAIRDGNSLTHGNLFDK